MSAFVKCVLVHLKVTFIQSSSSHAMPIADGLYKDILKSKICFISAETSVKTPILGLNHFFTGPSWASFMHLFSFMAHIF